MSRSRSQQLSDAIIDTQDKQICRESLTIGREHEENDDGKGPFKVDREEDEGDKNVDKGRDDVEQDQLKGVVDRCTAIEDAENLARLAMSVEREG